MGPIRRPWDDADSNRSGGYSTDVEDDYDDDDEVDGDEEINVDDDRGTTTTTTTKLMLPTTTTTTTVCPLDALLKMTSKTFEPTDQNSRDNGE